MIESNDELEVPGRPRFRSLVGVGAVAVLIVITTLTMWPATVGIEPPGIAVSWRAALQLAARLGLRHGNEFVFTYGPLGFLTVTRFYDAAAGTMSIAATAIMSLGVMGSVALLLRTRYSLVATVVGTVVASRFLAISDPMIGPVIAALAWASWALYQRLPLRGAIVFIVAGSVLGAVALLMKFNAGIAVLAIVAAVAVVSVPRRPWLMVVGVLVACAAVAAAWLLAGQRLADLRPFLATSFDLASGYSTAMALPIPGWQVPAAVLSMVAVLIVLLVSSRDLSATHRLGLLAAASSVAFFAWKHGVIRQGLDGYFAELVLIGLLMIDWRRVARPLAAGTMALPIALFALSSPNPLAWVRVDRSIATAGEQLATAIVPMAAGDRARILRDALRAEYGLPPTILAAIAGRSTHVDGWETEISVAYPEIEWRPEPIFQSYSAYTQRLDHINAEFLRGQAAPDRILRPRPHAIDKRRWLFEGPEAVLEMFCRYREVAVTMRWQVVARGPDRCGEEEVISVATVAPGSAVPVPPLDDPSSLIGVRISGLGSALDTLSSTLYRGPLWSIDLDGRRYRLVPGTASGPLLLGTTADLGYASGYGVSGYVRQVGVSSDAPWTTSNITYTFFRIVVRE